MEVGLIIRLVTGPYFLGTKMEAFRARGLDDYFASPDLEDVIAVVDGRIELVEETRSSSPELREYLSEVFFELLSFQAFRDALPGYLLPDAASQQRAVVILERLTALAQV